MASRENYRVIRVVALSSDQGRRHSRRRIVDAT